MSTNYEFIITAENTKTLKHLCFRVLRPKAVRFRALVLIISRGLTCKLAKTIKFV
jgi:hypothetical protein